MEIAADKVSLAGGAWSPSTESLFKIRQEIAYNMKEFEKLTKDKKFIEAFGEVRGEKQTDSKRVYGRRNSAATYL